MLIDYIKEVVGDTIHLYRYYTFKGKLTLTAIAILSMFNIFVGTVYDLFETYTFTWEGNLRRRIDEYRNPNKS